MCTPHFFSRPNGVRRSTFDAGLVTKFGAFSSLNFPDVNINSQCLVLNDRSIDENLKRRQINCVTMQACVERRPSKAVRKREKMRNAHISEMRSKVIELENKIGDPLNFIS